MVQFAAALRRPEQEAQFAASDRRQLPPFQPRKDWESLRVSGPDSIPWLREDTAEPAFAQRLPTSKASTAAARTVSPEQHIRAAWDADKAQPTAACPRRTRRPPPAGIRSALLWQRDCPDFERWLLGQVAHWWRVAARLAPATAAWKAGLSEHVKSVLPKAYNGPLHKEMLLASGHPDNRLVDDISQGFKVRGVLPDTSIFDSVPPADMPSPVNLDAALRSALRRRDQTLQEMFAAATPEPDTEELLRQTRAELAEGKFGGPWQVTQAKDGAISSTVPFRHWLPTRRFARTQSGTGTSYKVRPIDDCTASGLNPATAAVERMKMTGLEELMNTAQFIADEFGTWGADGQPVLAKGDHKQAYRQWPVAQEDECLLVILIFDPTIGTRGGFWAFSHRALPFGAFAAVWGYHRISFGVVRPLRRLFAVPQYAYVDDFNRISPRRHAALLQWTFVEIHNLLGIPLKEEKDHGPAAAIELLGLEVVAAQDWAGLQLTTKRRAALRHAADEALRARTLSARDAARLGGQLGFATSALFGRFGRIYANAVSAHHGGWTTNLQHALQWWRAILTCPFHYYQDHRRQRPAAVAWIDGSWDQTNLTGAIGGMILTTHRGNFCFSAEVPQHLRAELLQQGKQQRNSQIELLALLVLLLTFPDELRGCDLLVWEDNSPTMACVTSGAAGDADSQALVAAIWLLCAVLGVNPWLEWVASEANPGDCFSRPAEREKQRLAEHFKQKLSLRPLPARWPASIHMGAPEWATALHATGDAGPMDRRQLARLALGTRAVDGVTISRLLAAVSIDAADGEVTLGWMRTRRRGNIAAATHVHSELLRLLSLAAAPFLQGKQCSTVVLRKGECPRTPQTAAPRSPLAVCVARKGGGGCVWATTPAQLRNAMPQPEDVCIAYFCVPAEGSRELRRIAPLLKIGLAVLG